ncbi:MAG: bacterial Ig-like domain-containing protein [Oscillospiraceae bacterium]
MTRTKCTELQKAMYHSIYKNGQFLATETYSTNYIDPNGTSSDTYQVAPIVNGVEGEKCDSVAPFASGSNYFDIPVDRPKSTLTTTTTITTDENGNELPENQWHTETKVNEYTIGDTSCGDLDGDGEYELIVKWDCASRDNSQAGLTGNVYLDAYKLNGKKLWRIDLGKNIRAGAHYTQFLVYDFDMDGKAEVACKTAPGSIDGAGKYVSETSSVEEIRNANDNTVSYVNQNGYILDGNEYFTAFDGETGKTIDTIYYPIPRLDYESWGDTNGNRCDRYVASVAWLDGQRPYAVYWRGYYMGRNGRQRHGACGISLENGVLNPKYKFDTYSEDTDAYTPGNEKYVGEGNHNMTVADVDDDGNDEFISATLCYEVNDEDKLMPKWYGGRQHGDALHIGNYDPTNNNFEYFSVHEHGDFGMTLMDAKTGEEAFHVSDSNDTGRGLIANTGMGGYYQMSSNAGTYVAYGNNVFKKVNASMGQNFRIFWDGDLYDEELDLSSMVVKAYYSDKTSKTITDYTVSGYDSTKVGKQTVTVHYLDMTDTFDVTVAEGELSSIEIASNPSKTTYFTGEQLDTSGLSVKLNYANNSSKTITDGFDVSGFDNQTVGTNTLTVSYGGKTTTFTVTIVNSELTSYVNDDFESYDDSQITLKSQTLTKQTQDLGPFKLTLGTSGKKTDSYPHFAILTDNGNKSLEIATGGMSNPSRGPIIEFGDSIALPDFADIPANKYLVFDFDALYQGDTSNVQLYGVTDSYLSTSSDKLTYDQYLSVNKNANIPIGKWVNIHLVVNSKKDLFLTISDKSGNVLDSRKVTTSGDKFEKFVFYGGVGKIQLDNLKIYEDKISSLTLTPPTKTSYALGEELNLDGMVAKLNYSDKSVGTTAYTVSGYDKTKVGKQTVTVSYGDYSANFDVTVNGISSIEVTPPTKTTYLEGQDLNTDGMVVTAVTSDNQRITVPAGYSVRGFNKTKLGKQTITVTYQGLSTEFEVNVNSVKSIELTKPTKLEYKYGESLDTSGMSVKAIYDDNQSEVIKSDYSVTGYDKTKSGTQTITVTYRNQTATFDVTVAEPVITKFEITTPPTTTEYYVGQDLKTDGMVVTVTFEDESTKTTTAYTLSGYDKNTVGAQTVTVSYKGFSATFDVTVKEVEKVEISDVTVEDKTYDGKPIEYSGTATSDNYNGDYEYIWEKADGTVLDSAPINACSYKLVVKVSDETFAHTGSKEIPFNINKAALTITAENKSIAFGMNAPEFTCKADGLVDGDTISATYSCDYTVESPIGDYAIIPTDCTFTSGSKDNYDITYVNGTLTVKEAQKVEINGVTVENKTYDGIAVQYSGTAESADYDGEFDYIWQTADGITLDSAPINAGDYKLVVKVPSDNLEYVGSTEVPFTIDKADLTITAENMSTNVNSVVPAYKFTSSGLIGDDELDTIFSCEYTKDSDVGTYVITPTDCTFTSDVKNNYNIEYVNGTLSVYGSSYNKASKTVKIYSNHDTDVDCYVVSYAENGTLDGIKKEHCSLKADEISTIDISSLNIAENDSIKIFLWDNNLTPVEITN